MYNVGGWKHNIKCCVSVRFMLYGGRMTKPTDDAEAEYFAAVAVRVSGIWAAVRKKPADLAELLGVHPESARAKLRGDRRFTLDDLRLIARATGVTIGDLADEDDDE